MSDRILFDGRNALWRAASTMGGVAGLSSNGEPTGAIYGFLTIMLKAHARFGGRVVVCWDDWEHGPAARRAVYPEYKRKGGEPTEERKQAVAEVVSQEVQLMEFLSAAGIPQCRAARWEADDVMGTLAVKHADAWKGVVVFTGDRDLLQCVRKGVRVVRPQNGGGVLIETSKTVEERWGVPPSKFADLKALMGDPGDNIPGCKGIGEKGATRIMQAYPTLEGALDAVRTSIVGPLPESLAKKLKAGEAATRLSKQLTLINTKAEVEYLPVNPSRGECMRLLQRWKMYSLTKDEVFTHLMALGD